MLVLSLGAAGCGMSGSELPSLTTASVAPVEAPKPQRVECPAPAPSSGVTVQDVIAQARLKSGESRPSAADVQNARGKTEAGELACTPTSSPAGRKPALIAAEPAQSTGQMVGKTILNPELTIDFAVSATGLAEKERRAIAAAGQAHKTAGGKEIRVYAGPASTGNPFEQIVIAQKRARFVSGLLPGSMVLLAEYDPTQDEDTVRIEFVPKS